jgi:predicted RNA binding protein YcfA (HicA-like mRNA interferase family)
MGRLPGINHLQAVRAFEKVGFTIARQGKHIIMKRETAILVIPRNNPIQAVTMGAIVKAAGLSVEDFKKLL